MLKCTAQKNHEFFNFTQVWRRFQNLTVFLLRLRYIGVFWVVQLSGLVEFSRLTAVTNAMCAHITHAPTSPPPLIIFFIYHLVLFLHLIPTCQLRKGLCTWWCSTIGQHPLLEIITLLMSHCHSTCSKTNATINQIKQLKLLENVTMKKPFANVYRLICPNTTVRVE